MVEMGVVVLGWARVRRLGCTRVRERVLGPSFAVGGAESRAAKEESEYSEAVVVLPGRRT